MSLKALLIFVTVYRKGSFTSAAAELNISQPAVSSAIRDLEHHYGIQLFTREGRGIQKTKNADFLYEYASHITALSNDMEQVFCQHNAQLPLRIGASISIGTCIMPECLANYAKEKAGQMPYLKIDSSDIIAQMVEGNQLDFALIEGTPKSEKILSEPLIKDRLLLVCSPQHPFAQKKDVRLHELSNESFLLREENSGTRQLIESVLLLHSFPIIPVWESTSTAALIQGVLQNLGLSILPERMLRPYLKSGDLIELTIPGVRFHREYVIIYHQNKYLNPTITEAFDFMKSYVRKST